MDASGAVYVAGGTSSPDFPANVGDTSVATGGSTLGSEGPLDAFVAKIDTNGQLEWATIIGGPNYDRAYGISVDSTGIYIAGRAGDEFPTTSGALQENFGGDNVANSRYGQQDGFVAKLSLDGTSVLWSTYFGGPGAGVIRELDVDDQGRPYIGFSSEGGNPHITADAHRSTRLGITDAGFAVLSADGQSTEYATYLGGTSVNASFGMFGSAPSIRVAPDGGTFLAFFDSAPDVPVTAGVYQPTLAGELDMVVARFTPQRTLDWMTYLGGSGNELNETHSLTIDDQGRPVVSGETDSSDFPVTSGAYQSGQGGRGDGFVSILSASGESLVASTYFGGSRFDSFEGIATAPDGSIILTGATDSTSFPASTDAAQTFNGGARDGLIVRFSSDLSSVLYFTYLGGSRNEYTHDIDVNQAGIIGIVGNSNSNDFPAVNSSDTSVQGDYGAIYGRLTSN